MRLTCSYIQKKVRHLFSSAGRKKKSSLVPLKQALGGNFIWLRKCCSCAPLDFAASCLILFKACEANTASLLQKKWLALLLQAARGGEVQGTPSSWHFFKTGGVRGSAMLGNTMGNICWLLVLWRMGNGASAGCSEGATTRKQRHGYALLKNQLVKSSLEGIWNFVSGICVRAVISFISFGCVCLAAKSGKVCLSSWWESEGWRELWVSARQIAILCFVKTFVEVFSTAHLSVPVSEVVLSTSLLGLGCCYPHPFLEFTPLTSSCYYIGLLTSWKWGFNPFCSHSSSSIPN